MVAFWSLLWPIALLTQVIFRVLLASPLALVLVALASATSASVAAPTAISAPASTASTTSTATLLLGRGLAHHLVGAGLWLGAFGLLDLALAQRLLQREVLAVVTPLYFFYRHAATHG